MTRSFGRRACWGKCAGVIVAAALFAVGCRSTNRLDGRALERNLPAALFIDHPEVVTNVHCPSDITRAFRAEVTCQAHIGDTAVSIAVTQIDDRGAVHATLDKPVFDVAGSALLLAKRLSTDLGVETTIVCDGPAVRVLVVGEVLTCRASDSSGRSRTLAVTVTDSAGTLDVRLG